MTKKLTNILGAGLILVGSLGLLGGCASQKKTSGLSSSAIETDLFACSKIIDANGSGKTDTGDNFVGIGREFNIDGTVYFIAQIKNRQNKQLTAELYYNKAGMVGEPYSEKITSNDHYTVIELSPEEIQKRGGVGNYTMRWYLDGSLLGMTLAEVTKK